MPRVREHDREPEEAPGGRWQRRAVRRAAERRRIPKHGKTYVTLVEQMLAQRAKDGAPGAATPALHAPRPRRARPSAD
ncbi:MAG TPA: hypothetical protein VK066_08510 [Chloroflexota bacterium]|nr:hypothetical protein [Chloroflexota bacterium]